MAWYNGALFTNPGAGQTLVETGKLPAAIYDVVLHLQSSKQTLVILERRNASNTLTLQALTIRLSAGEYLGTFPGIELASGERLRAVMGESITGQMEADLFATVRPEVFALP